MSEELRREIEQAFSGVTRDGGVSWRESNVVDERGSMEERLAARALDTDATWLDLVTDPPWPEHWGSFSFLDPIGFRYYLPAFMVRSLTLPGEDSDQSLKFHLTLPRFSLRKHMLSRWSLLTEPQRKCIAHFLEYMDEHDVHGGWERALKSYWHQFLDSGV